MSDSIISEGVWMAAFHAYWGHERSKINRYEVNVNDSLRAGVHAALLEHCRQEGCKHSAITLRGMEDAND